MACTRIDIIGGSDAVGVGRGAFDRDPPILLAVDQSVPVHDVGQVTNEYRVLLDHRSGNLDRCSIDVGGFIGVNVVIWIPFAHVPVRVEPEQDRIALRVFAAADLRNAVRIAVVDLDRRWMLTVRNLIGVGEGSLFFHVEHAVGEATGRAGVR